MNTTLPNLTKQSIALFAAGAMFVGVCTAALPAYAQVMPPSAVGTKDVTETGISEINFITSPPRLELKGKPGDTLQTMVKLKNVTESEQMYTTQALDFIVGEDGFTPIPVTEKVSGRWSAASWMSMSPAESRLPKNGQQEIDVIIQIPQDALPGGHYAMITQSLKQADEATQVGETVEKTAAVITPRVGTLVYITVEGDTHEEAFIRDFSAPTWVEFGPVDFTYVVENQSDIHIAPQATITIKNIFGQTKDVITVDSTNIFPLTNRSFDATWETFWGFGPYTANLDVAYGSKGNTVSVGRLFWVIPYRILLAIFVVLFSFIAILISMRRHIAHRNDLKTKQIEVLEEKVRELESEKQQQ